MSLTFSEYMSISRAKLLAMIITAVFFTLSCSEQSLGYGPTIRVGDSAPKSNNRIVDDPGKWYEVSTMDSKVSLYRWRIADLIQSKKPFIVVFGTPQHCTMCVDQIVRVAIMQEKYGESFSFIHVDGYKDNAVWVEWGIKGEPWTFIVDSQGVVRNVYPGQTELALLEKEMKALLKVSG